MSFWEPDNLKSAVGGQWLARVVAAERKPVVGISTDSRSIRAGEAFVALRGERFDGHQYLRQVGEAGASLAIVDDEARVRAVLGSLAPTMSVLLVPDAGRALLQLAGAYRRTLVNTRVIAVGGSNGKTTTTRLIESVLSASLRGTASRKSFNNAVGVPLTILSAKRTDQFLVCEVGTNAPGEIAPLAGVIQPDIAVITSIGREHLEGLGSLEGVVAEEARLLDGVRQGGAAVITGDSPQLKQRMGLERAGATQIVRFGFADDCDLRITSCTLGPAGTDFKLNDRAAYRVPLLGRHNASNAAAAIGVAKRLGLSDEVIREALSKARGAEMRLEVVEAGGVLFLNDSYNANPDSMIASLATFDECFARAGIAPAARRVAVVGDMLELGDHGPEAHRELGRRLGAMDLDLVVLVGPLAQAAAAEIRLVESGARIEMVNGQDDASIASIAAFLRAGDRVLLKASRRLALERVIGRVKAHGVGISADRTPIAAAS